ncbi:MAG: hypothetical protein WDW38_007335 [Sanguina aurantia]
MDIWKITLQSDVPTPTILLPTDVIVCVSLCGICGSDLHPYHEREQGLAQGTVVGHEFVGTVAVIGSQVSPHWLGARVMCPFTTSCGGCFYCKAGATCRCSHPQAHVFGWVGAGPAAEADASAGADPPQAAPQGLQGSQAQYVRVPLAESSLVKIPDSITDEEGILLGDILSTAFFCADNGCVSDGSSVAVVGCGPVGLLAIMASLHLGAEKVWAIDSVPDRLAMAAALGARPINFLTEDAKTAVMAGTEGRGADVVLEVVGLAPALELAYNLLRPMGVLSSVGVHTSQSFPFSPVDGYNRNLTYKSGRCPARRFMERLIPLVASHRLDFTQIITHRLGLSEGVHGYDIFDRKLDGAIKVVLDPWK